MASSGNWRAQLRHRQKSISKIKLKSQAMRWATEQQDRIEIEPATDGITWTFVSTPRRPHVSCLR